jgi:hypothetical protein
MNRLEEQKLIYQAIKKFPSEFRLKAYPGRWFSISAANSYISDIFGMMLYTEVQLPDGSWAPFAKGSPQELEQQIIK